MLIVKNKTLHTFGVVLLLAGFLIVGVEKSCAIKLTINQGEQSYKVIAVSASDQDYLETSKGTLNVTGTTAQLSVVGSDGPQSVILGYDVAGNLVSPSVVLSNPQRYCAKGRTRAYTAIRGSRFSIPIYTRNKGDVSYFRGAYSSSAGKSPKPSESDLTNLVDVGTNCLPSGNGLTEGLQKASSRSTRALSARRSFDRDSDGLSDIFDSDTDGDGVLNNYDSSFKPFFGRFTVFSNIKMFLEGSLNVNALGRNPTKAEVDTLTRNTTLAIEVKASTGQESELNCGGLSYCSSGGTGTILNSTSSFPGSAGGPYDLDGDGNGTITKGATGDFQLATNLSEFNEANAGDAFVQTVSTGGVFSKVYLSSLQFVFRSTPAMKTLVVNPSGTSSTYNFSYPIAAGSSGTATNCISVTPDGTGKISLDFVAWRPQRKGIPALGESDFVDLGNSEVSIDIPNAPSTSGTVGAGGPGLCPGSSYTTSDPNLTVISDGMQDSMGDKNASTANTVSFSFNLTSCLGTAYSLDSGEEVKLDLQFRNSVGDNAAQAFCVRRP